MSQEQMKAGNRGILKVISHNPISTLREVCAQWLRGGKLTALFGPAVSERGVVAPALFTDPEHISSLVPFLPAMTVQGASIIDEIAFEPAPGAKVGVILRPCELRAVVELVKLNQVYLDGLILIGVDCPGTYRGADYLEIKGGDEDFERRFLLKQDAYLKDERLRPACRLCEYPVPLVFDLHIGYLGMSPEEELWVDAGSAKGAALLEGLDLEPEEEPESRQRYLKEFRAQRLERSEEAMRALDRELLGEENLVRYFARCLNCHNCMKVCPVCYCRECFFESEALERDLDETVRLARHKGASRLPQGTLLFHITRMAHMMTSCVNCGVCEDSCPVGIHLSVLFKKVARNAQKEFGYLSGRALDEPLPLVVFREDEFRTIGE